MISSAITCRPGSDDISRWAKLPVATSAGAFELSLPPAPAALEGSCYRKVWAELSLRNGTEFLSKHAGKPSLSSLHQGCEYSAQGLKGSCDDITTQFRANLSRRVASRPTSRCWEIPIIVKSHQCPTGCGLRDGSPVVRTVTLHWVKLDHIWPRDSRGKEFSLYPTLLDHYPVQCNLFHENHQQILQRYLRERDWEPSLQSVRCGWMTPASLAPWLCDQTTLDTCSRCQLAWLLSISFE